MANTHTHTSTHTRTFFFNLLYWLRSKHHDWFLLYALKKRKYIMLHQTEASQGTKPVFTKQVKTTPSVFKVILNCATYSIGMYGSLSK